MPAIAVIATGGTIANTPGRRVSVEDVLAHIAAQHPDSDPSKLATFSVREITRESAGVFTPDHWISFARAAQEAADDPAIDAVLVTHGTFTVEETAYFLHLTVRTAKPLVLTCAQRKHTTLGSDGDRNLVDAVCVALDPAAAGVGALVVESQEIHCAREVIKGSERPSGFHSGLMGPLGTVSSDRVCLYRAPLRRHTHRSELALPSSLPRVDVIPVFPGADAVLVEAAEKAGAEGIVVNGFAFNGRPHPGQIEALQAAADRGVAVVLANRGMGGRVPLEAHQEDLADFYGADNLSAHKARMLLQLALAAGHRSADLQQVFHDY